MSAPWSEPLRVLKPVSLYDNSGKQVAMAVSREHIGELTRRANAYPKLVEGVKTALRIIETGDQRLLAQDGPAGQQPPDISLDEWRQMYDALIEAFAAIQEEDDE